MHTKTNFWEENIEVPLRHSYSNKEDLRVARGCLARWSEEWQDKKAAEMAIFNGKREVSINEGETASSLSQSRVSHTKETALRKNEEAKIREMQLGGIPRSRKAVDGRKVNFEEPNSPGLPPDFRGDRGHQDADGKEGI